MRIATFNLENLDEGGDPSLEDRIPILRPQLDRLRANIICLQEIHGQKRPEEKRDVLALKELLKSTRYEDFHLAHTPPLVVTTSPARLANMLHNTDSFSMTHVLPIRLPLMSPLQAKKGIRGSERATIWAASAHEIK